MVVRSPKTLSNGRFIPRSVTQLSVHTWLLPSPLSSPRQEGVEWSWNDRSCVACSFVDWSTGSLAPSLADSIELAGDRALVVFV
jgi:hypothetical protein